MTRLTERIRERPVSHGRMQMHSARYADGHAQYVWKKKVPQADRADGRG